MNVSKISYTVILVRFAGVSSVCFCKCILLGLQHNKHVTLEFNSELNDRTYFVPSTGLVVLRNASLGDI